MEKEMLVVAKLKEGMFEKFMGFMQSPEGLAEREKVAVVEKTIPVGVWPLEIEGPHGITVSPDGEHWYLSMAHGMPYGHLHEKYFHPQNSAQHEL